MTLLILSSTSFNVEKSFKLRIEKYQSLCYQGLTKRTFQLFLGHDLAICHQLQCGHIYVNMTLSNGIDKTILAVNEATFAEAELMGEKLSYLQKEFESLSLNLVENLSFKLESIYHRWLPDEFDKTS